MNITNARLKSVIDNAMKEIPGFDSLSVGPETSIQMVGLDSIGLSHMILQIEDEMGEEMNDDLLMELSEVENIGQFYTVLDGFYATHAAIS